jgi:hypothetical protein
MCLKFYFITTVFLYVVAQLFEALHYKIGGPRVRFPMVLLEFLTQSFQSHYGPGVNSASNRNEYQEYFLGVKAAGA